jgi:cell division protease FtsH
MQSTGLATELVQKLPAAALAGLISSLAAVSPVAAADFLPPQQSNTIVAEQQQTPSSLTFQGSSASAPAVRDENALPEGTQWRYSEFISAVESGKVERVRFSKDGTMLQLTAVDGRRATVVLPNDPELVDILAKNGVDISVSEGDQQGNYVALLGNILFPLIAFGGLFFLFRRAQGGPGGSGPMGPMGGPMEFGRSKSKFQEVPETGVTFSDVAVSGGGQCAVVDRARRAAGSVHKQQEARTAVLTT